MVCKWEQAGAHSRTLNNTFVLRLNLLVNCSSAPDSFAARLLCFDAKSDLFALRYLFFCDTSLIVCFSELPARSCPSI